MTRRKIRLRSGAGGLVIQAAATPQALPTCSILAYTGGRLMLANFDYPVVIDLAALEIGSQRIPLLRDHDHAQIVGHSTTIKTDGRELRLEGVISGTGPAAVEVRDSGRQGFPWEASVGADCDLDQIDEIPAGSSILINGQTLEGPLCVARAACVYEVSFVALGADEGGASARIKGSAQGGIPMGFEDWLKSLGLDPATLTPEAKDALQKQYDAQMAAKTETEVEAEGEDTDVEAEEDTTDEQQRMTASRKRPNVQAAGRRQLAASSGNAAHAAVAEIRAASGREARRISAIRNLCGGKHAAIEAQAIEQGWSPLRTENAVMKAERPTAPLVHAGSGRGATMPILAAALHTTLKLPKPEAAHDAKTLEAADKTFRRGIGLQELLIHAAAAAGHSFNRWRGNEKAILQAAFSSSDFSGVLADVINKVILEAYSFVDQSWREIAGIRPVNDFKTIHSYRLTDQLTFEKLAPTGEIKEGALSDTEYTNRADTYAKMALVNRQDIVNDDAGAFKAVPRMLARGGAIALNEVFWRVLHANSAFYTTGNNNLLTGTGSAFSFDALAAAEQRFTERKDPVTKQRLGIKPQIVLVGPNNRILGENLLMGPQLANVTATPKSSTYNNFAARGWKLVASPFVSDTELGGTATKWYLLADPKDVATIEVCFLNGQETPTIEDIEPAPNQLGIAMRGYHDFGVALQDPNGGVASTGVAPAG